MADVPAPLTYGTVVGHFISVLADSSDDGGAPDIITRSGTVTITPTVKWIHVPGYFAAQEDIVAQIVDGELLSPDGTTPLNLLATDSPGVSPTPWQYTAKFSITGVKTQPPSVNFSLPGGTTVDITQIVPVPVGPPIQTTVITGDALDARIIELLATHGGSAGGSGGGGAYSGARVTLASDLPLGGAQLAAVALNTVLFDEGGFTQGVPGGETFKIPTGFGGYYRIDARFTATPNSLGGAVFIMQVNGTDRVVLPLTFTSTGNDYGNATSEVLHLNAGDVVHVNSFANVSGVTVRGTEQFTALTITRLNGGGGSATVDEVTPDYVTLSY